MKKDNIINNLRIFLVLTILIGVVYPLLVTGFAKIFFPGRSSGSIIYLDGKAIGSELIGQQFSSPKYFWGRPSTCNYDPMNSGASNKGWLSKDLKDSVEKNRKKIAENHQIKEAEVPEELIFNSASGIDPHISPKSVYLQVDRIVKVRNFNAKQKENLINLIKVMIEQPTFGFLGETRVNILLLNLKLDKL